MRANPAMEDEFIPTAIVEIEPECMSSTGGNETRLSIRFQSALLPIQDKAKTSF